MILGKKPTAILMIIFAANIFLWPCYVHARRLLVRCQLLYNTTLPILGESTPWFAAKIKEVSEGQMVFKLYDPGKLVPPLEILESVSKGRIDAGSTAAGFWAGKLPAAPLFSSIPFGPEAPEFLAWMYEGNGLKLYQEMYDRAGYNVRVLPIAIIAPETAGWYTKPINSADDLKGLKMRFYGLGGQVMQRLGVSVNLLPPGEIFPALEKGAIDATEFSMPSLDKNLGFHKVCKYNYFPAWHQQATFAELLINKDVWEKKMTPAQRTLIEICAMATVTRMLAKSEATQASAIRENAEKSGVKNMYYSDELLTTFKKAWEEVAKEQAEDPFFSKVYEDLQAFRVEYAIWSQLGFLPRKTGSQ
jgi:TRAP-type mannitol/chloroaromatic compound transport system substrate-binding protein